ncbi:MAG: outer membrane beta-barrel protein, partial [Tannerellaceae bacterium]|nr:outer membrane beta-barrel protein [Tannerellaceae bacterium]
MKNIFTLPLAFILFAFTAKAAVPVSGKIIDAASGNPLEYANVVLLSLPDSAFVEGTVSDESGSFRLEGAVSGKYLLKVSYIGFENEFIPVDVSSTAVYLGDIRLSESNVLQEVVVTSRVPPFQPGVSGGIVANVSTTLLSSVGTATDVLQRMPGILAEGDKITVFGKGSPIVYINNRKVNDMQELERLESSEISTVELISNPGAKYDAEGRAVLLIKTKTRINGFSAQATERLRQGNHLSDNENVSISYTKDKLNLFASYYHNYTKRDYAENHYFTLENAGEEWRYDAMMPAYWSSTYSNEASAGVDYSLNDRHTVGGQYRFYDSKNKIIMPINTDTYLNGAPHETSTAQSLTTGNYHQHLVNAFYNGDISESFSTRFDFDYLKNYDDRTQRSDETINSTETNTVDIYNKTDYSLYAGKLTNSYKSSFGLIEFGAEYNSISGDGLVQSNVNAGDSEFTNTEQKAAGFVSYSHKLSSINLSAGLRYEYTSERYTQGEDAQPVIDRSYSDFYPNISFSTNLENVDLSLAFNKRTSRPSFTQLNGNVVYVNRFVFQKGNPFLSKSNIYDVNLQAMLRPFSLSAGYAYTENPVLLFFEEEGNNSILLTYANFPKMQDFNATLNFNHKIAFWQPNYTIGVAKPFFSATYNGKEIEYNRANYFVNAFNDFTLPAGFVLSCNFRYQSDQMDGYLDSKGYRRLDAGLRKSFLDNTLRLNLMVYDIFDWVSEENHMQLNNLRWNADKKNETRYVTLSVTYMFNNYNRKYRGGSAAADDI